MLCYRNLNSNAGEGSPKTEKIQNFFFDIQFQLPGGQFHQQSYVRRQKVFTILQQQQNQQQ